VFHVACELTCDFAFEGVGQPAAITIQVDLDVNFDGVSR
jgi:hypothetical protein